MAIHDGDGGRGLGSCLGFAVVRRLGFHFGVGFGAGLGCG